MINNMDLENRMVEIFDFIQILKGIKKGAKNVKCYFWWEKKCRNRWTIPGEIIKWNNFVKKIAYWAKCKSTGVVHVTRPE